MAKNKEERKKKQDKCEKNSRHEEKDRKLT
jgi:hypothetical protein